jgi:hypothetical protein
VDQLIVSVVCPGSTPPLVLTGVTQGGNVGDVDFVVVFPGQTHHIPNHVNPAHLRAVMNLNVLMFLIKHQRHILQVPDNDDLKA